MHASVDKVPKQPETDCQDDTVLILRKEPLFSKAQCEDKNVLDQ
jgi:hypothetical protein